MGYWCNRTVFCFSLVSFHLLNTVVISLRLFTLLCYNFQGRSDWQAVRDLGIGGSNPDFQVNMMKIFTKKNYFTLYRTKIPLLDIFTGSTTVKKLEEQETDNSEQRNGETTDSICIRWKKFWMVLFPTFVAIVTSQNIWSCR